MLIYMISARHRVGDNRKNPVVVYLLKTIVYWRNYFTNSGRQSLNLRIIYPNYGSTP